MTTFLPAQQRTPDINLSSSPRSHSLRLLGSSSSMHRVYRRRPIADRFQWRVHAYETVETRARERTPSLCDCTLRVALTQFNEWKFVEVKYTGFFSPDSSWFSTKRNMLFCVFGSECIRSINREAIYVQYIFFNECNMILDAFALFMRHCTNIT